MEDNEIVFSKLRLDEGDSLIIKLNTEGLSEEDSLKKLESIREDSFTKFIQDKGHNVFVSYSGLDFSVLRLNGVNDKVVAYLNVDSMTPEEEEKYVDLIKSKLVSKIGEERLIMLPVRNNSPVLKILNKEE